MFNTIRRFGIFQTGRRSHGVNEKYNVSWKLSKHSKTSALPTLSYSHYSRYNFSITSVVSATNRNVVDGIKSFPQSVQPQTLRSLATSSRIFAEKESDENSPTYGSSVGSDDSASVHQVVEKKVAETKAEGSPKKSPKRRPSSESERLHASIASNMDHRIFDEQIFDQMCRGQETVPMARLQRALKRCGLWKNDPRLAQTTAKMTELARTARRNNQVNAQLDIESFRDCIRDNIALIKRAFTGDLIIPDFGPFCDVIDDLYRKCRTNSDGEIASYIPQLSKYSPDFWGVSLCTIDGQRHCIGDVTVPFTLQSSGKPLNYALALNELGEDFVHRYIGHEPSGESFNKIKLSAQKQPHNPLINAGAIVVCSLLHRGHSLADRFDHVMNQYRRINGGEFLGFNNSIFLSEKECANRNYALGHYMMAYKCFPENTSLNDTMDLYFQLCSVETTANSAAVMAATLANGGYCPITGEEVLSATSVRNTLSLMHSCGMYDYSGGFAFKVGLPAKSSVSGAILLIVPNVLGMCLWSPPLERMGNSVRGVQFCQELVNNFNFHHYDNLKHTKQKRDPRARPSESPGSRVVDLLSLACSGDLAGLQRLSIRGQDMSIADYDGRTALHLAACEGHLNCVKFLVEKCGVALEPKDRWGHTPCDDAVRFQKATVESYLRERGSVGA